MATRPAVKDRPAVRKGPRVATPPRKRRKLIRWIEYAAVIAVVVVGSVVAIITLTGDDDALPFEVEAGSLAIASVPSF